MASLIDSEAHFSKRAGEVRLGDAALRTLRRLGLNSMGSLAYAHGQPGQPLDEASFTNWVQSTVDANVSLGDTSAIKRLLFESQTLVLAALREQVVNPDSAALKKVPEAERDRRMKHLRDTLIGVLIEGPMEPGHALLDLCAQQRESGQLRYIPPERCISRVHEVTTASNPKKQLEFESDKLSIKEQVVAPDMQVHDLLKLLEAFRRRGLAFAFAEAVSFLDYERYVNSLFSHCHREPPPGYSRCALPQLVQADKLVFTKLIEDGVKPRKWTQRALELQEEENNLKCKLAPHLRSLLSGKRLMLWFGLKQGAKVRLIDDFSGSGVNSTVQACESPKPHSTDVVAALLLQLARSTNGDPRQRLDQVERSMAMLLGKSSQQAQIF
ncbi:unnamed protein product [Effrenium voratum]|uniref:Uncharacterized protein n=1 Tax=Effrenium voratum TaxID=2562239 RepID=A0AA36J1G4_9DINO|nr:unnamed protein product [Effrenium voratum]